MDSNLPDKVIKEIGRGGYSVVNLIERNGVRMARKEIDVAKMSQEEVSSINEEINLLSVLRDRSVLIYKDCKYDKFTKKCFIYTEYLENGDLFHLIQKKSVSKEYFNEEV